VAQRVPAVGGVPERLAIRERFLNVLERRTALAAAGVWALWLAAVLGVVILVAALVMTALETRQGVTVSAVVELVAGAIAVGIGLYFLLSDDPYLRAAADHFADVTGRPAGPINDQLHVLAARGTIDVSRSAGIFLFTVGGLIAVVAGLIGIVVARSIRAPVPAEAAAPFPGAERPAGGPLGAPPPPPREPEPQPPEAGGTGPGPSPPLPPAEPPKPGEPGTTPGPEE
jgi:hypothetical protein